MRKLERLVVNFMDRCNLRCPYCYIPFDKQRVDFAVLERVVDRAAEAGFTVITFGGGDPLNHRETRGLFRRARMLGLEVQLDTNGCALLPSDLPLLEDCVSLCALPLDGSVAKVHDFVRAAPGNFLEVTQALKVLAARKSVRLKINTMVGRPNCHDLVALAEVVRRLGPEIWSVYQFMPLHVPATVAARFGVGDGDFRKVTSQMNIPTGTKLEVWGRHDRVGTYVFSSTNGSLYAHDPSGEGYVFVGSIFDDGWRDSIDRVCASTLRHGARHRYLSLPLAPR
jgi:sulfatase maturation enzyme AslB (radical SAM superfamily)